MSVSVSASWNSSFNKVQQNRPKSQSVGEAKQHVRPSVRTIGVESFAEGGVHDAHSVIYAIRR